MRKTAFFAAVVAAAVLLAGCSAGTEASGQPSPTARAVAASDASTGSRDAEAYRLVVEGLVESPEYEELVAASIAFLDDDPTERCANGDFESLREDAAKFRELAGKLPKYDGENVTAIIAYQHAERFAQSVAFSADAFSTARTVDDVEAAMTLFGSGYDEMRELTKTVIELRESNG